jgi:hypothetical protein
MKSETFAVLGLFQDRRQYRVPFYQRAYVWNKEDQWDRLWEDIQEKAEGRLVGGKSTPHFLGAAVLEPQERQGLLGIEARDIIDGQQRFTTLQYVLAALAIVLRDSESGALLALVDSCLRNPNPETMEQAESEIFKVWPTFRDRAQYVDAMSATDLVGLRDRFPASFTQNGTLRKVGIDHPPALEAIWHFYSRMADWISTDNDQEHLRRVQAMSEAILRDLNLVVISLSGDDDAQIIFETLNGHGAQLHATDLIRNFVFMRADREGAAAAELYDTMWSPFETSFWSEEQRRGRLKRPRLEWFMQTALQAELREDIDIGRLYVGYRRFAIGRATQFSASEQLRLLSGYSGHYRELVGGTGDSPIARYGKDIAAWDASTTHPVALAVATSATESEQVKIFADITSYFVRRSICGLTSKNYNKLFIQLLKGISATESSHSQFRSALAALDGDASRWPRDDEFRKSWLDAAIYPGRLDAPRVSWLLAQLERGLRSARTEEPGTLAIDLLDVDHILPSSWFEYWPLSDGTKATETDAQAALVATYSDQPLTNRHAAVRRRETAKVKIGNLTLLHYGVNRGLQNREFPRKREKLFEESNLQLNRALMRLQSWDEDAIDRRGLALFDIAVKLWQGPV